MTKETTPNSELPLFETIVQQVKEFILKHGGHHPTLFLHDGQDTIRHELTTMPSGFDQRQAMMFALGVQIAQAQSVNTLQSVIFVSEAWFSRVQGEEPPKSRPSQDPNRMEVIITNHITLPYTQAELRIFKMVRNKKGKLVRLGLVTGLTEAEIDQIESPLLNAFIAGYFKRSR